MSKFSILKTACAMSLAAACVLGLAGCSDNDEGGVALTGGVAATVNGVEIAEDDVTLFVESVRTSYGVTDEESWAHWMLDYGYTPESVREEIINGLVEQEMIRQSAAEMGITADAEEIDGYVETMKSYYETEEEWEAALVSAGMTEDEYRKSLELSILSEGIMETFADETASDEDMLLYAQMFASSYDGAKRSSHILVSDEETAQEVLDKIMSGELEFADAAAEYSNDSSAANGGDVGWDALSSFVTEYQTALDALDEGEVSGLVTSTYGVHIIKCTEIFTAPEEVTSPDQLPAEFVDYLKEMLDSSAQSEAYAIWLDEQIEAADIVINEMPEGLSYYIDLAAHEAAHEAEALGVDGDDVVIEEAEDAISAEDEEIPAGVEVAIEEASDAVKIEGDEAPAEGEEVAE